MTNPFRDYADEDERIDPVESRPVPLRFILLAALAGLLPAALFGGFVWWVAT